MSTSSFQNIASSLAVTTPFTQPLLPKPLTSITVKKLISLDYKKDETKVYAIPTP